KHPCNSSKTPASPTGLHTKANAKPSSITQTSDRKYPFQSTSYKTSSHFQPTHPQTSNVIGSFSTISATSKAPKIPIKHASHSIIINTSSCPSHNTYSKNNTNAPSPA